MGADLLTDVTDYETFYRIIAALTVRTTPGGAAMAFRWPRKPDMF
jgi:hypothetical protein